MHPLKAPSPDDMPPLFYQHFWPNVNTIVIKIVLDFLNHDVALSNFHETHIVLIPKTKNPKRVSNYKPISLCNVAYKLASKVVANRFKRVLQDVIYENQSTFVSERLITNNVLVAHEQMNHINRKKKGKNGEMALKLDMSKAYDQVERGCLQKIMSKLGFHEKRINLVMRCVSSVTLVATLFQQEGYSKGTHFPPTYFLFMQKGCLRCCTKLSKTRPSKGLLPQYGVQNFYTYFLWTIA